MEKQHKNVQNKQRKQGPRPPPGGRAGDTTAVFRLCALWLGHHAVPGVAEVVKAAVERQVPLRKFLPLVHRPGGCEPARCSPAGGQPSGACDFIPRGNGWAGVDLPWRAGMNRGFLSQFSFPKWLLLCINI